MRHAFSYAHAPIQVVATCVTVLSHSKGVLNLVATVGTFEAPG
jgi:hypothetical protein